MSDSRLTAYLTFSFIGGVLAFGTFNLLSAFNNQFNYNIVFAGMMATLIGYVVENWINLQEELEND